MDNIWKILDIEPTADKREIKRAYAKQLKTKSPEENPEGFQELRRAYETAISYAEQKIDIIQSEITYHPSESDNNDHDGKQIDLITVKDNALAAKQNTDELFSILINKGEEEAIDFFKTIVSSDDIKDLEYLNLLESLLYHIVSNWKQDTKPRALFYEIYDHYDWVGIGAYLTPSARSQKTSDSINPVWIVLCVMAFLSIFRSCNNM